MDEGYVVRKIEQLCEENNWSHYRLSMESGIPHSTLHNILHRTTVPSVPSILRICNAFGLSMAQFLMKVIQQIIYQKQKNIQQKTIAILTKLKKNWWKLIYKEFQIAKNPDKNSASPGFQKGRCSFQTPVLFGYKNKTQKRINQLYQKASEKIKLNGVELVVISHPSAYRA